MRRREDVTIHPTADVSDDAEVGPGTRIWSHVQVREGAVIGSQCILGNGVYVDLEVRVGDRCKLQNGVFVFHGFNLEDGVFLGPGVMLLNDKHPRAINADGSLKSASDWTVSEAIVRRGAAVGGGAVVLPGVGVGRFAMVGAGAVVTRDVPDHAIVFGNPARLKGFACACGHQLEPVKGKPDGMLMRCPACGTEVSIRLDDYAQIEGTR
ncbi:MAG TPA: acyltransferase [Candidatus Limnocylindria bacterium]|jgi:acetyltransferase-like isoleucine patch superfamily enzyme|nr:acyltransferase [Candidatus Limnocylindria bacterium]